MRKIGIFTIFFLIVGCSSLPEPAPKIDFKLDSLELYISRGSLYQTEFEHYKIAGDKFFRECGEVQGGRYLPAEQKLEEIIADQTATLISSASEIDQMLSLNEVQELELPGKKPGMFDPGVFELRLNNRDKLLTSLDAVSSPDSKIERKLKLLAQQLRMIAGTMPCGNKEFFGL